MTSLKNKRTIKSGKIFEAYFEACENNARSLTDIDTKKGTKEFYSWKWNGKTYVALGFDHANGHFSSFSDRSSIISIHIAQLL